MQKNKLFQISVPFIFFFFSIGCTATSVEPQSREVIVEAKKNYKKSESVRFKIDTGKEKGYLYVVYLNKNGQKEVMAPSKKRVKGKVSFPEDFDVDVLASKDCKSCKEEKTTVYVLLSKDPILDIADMDSDKLLKLGTKLGEVKNRGLFLEDGNELVQKIELLVK